MHAILKKKIVFLAFDNSFKYCDFMILVSNIKFEFNWLIWTIRTFHFAIIIVCDKSLETQLLTCGCSKNMRFIVYLARNWNFWSYVQKISFVFMISLGRVFRRFYPIFIPPYGYVLAYQFRYQLEHACVI